MPDIRFNGKFGSADLNVYQCQLWDSTYTGSATEFPLKSVAFFRGRRGTNSFTPIRASSVELKGYKLTQTALDELLGAAVGRFTLELKRAADHATIDGGGGTLYWKGIVQTDLGEDDTARTISDIKITATDGLSLLREVKYLDTTGETDEPYTGRETHLVTIRNILEKIGYSLPTAFAAHWFPDDGEASDILWENAEVDQSIFYDDEGAPASCYDVLKNLLYPYGGVMFWREGRFVFVQKSQLGGGTFTANAYDEAGSPDGTITLGTTINSDAAVRVSGSRTYEPAFGSVSIIYNHGNIPSLIEGGDFTDDPGEWTFGTTGGEIRTSGGDFLEGPRGGVGRGGRLRINRLKVGFVPAFFYGSDESFTAFRDAIKTSDRYIEQTGATIQTGDFMALTGRFRIPHFEGAGNGTFNTFFTLQLGSNADGYLQRDGTFFTPADSEDLQALRTPGADWDTYGFALSKADAEGWYDFTIISEASPYTDTVRLRLWGTADINGSDLDPEGVEWADVAVLIVDDTGELRDSIQFTGITTSPEPGDEDLSVQLGQGPHPLIPGNVTWNGTDAENWKYGALAVEKLTKLLVRTRLGYQSGRIESRFETYKGIDYEMGDVVQIDGEPYDVVFNEKDLASQYDTIEARRIIYDDSDITFAELATDQGTYTIGSGGSSTSVVVDQADTAANIITTKGDHILGGEDGAAERFGSGETDGQVLVTDAAAAQGWSLAALTPITTKGDLIIGDATGEPARFATGTDGQVIETDAAAALGWSLAARTPITTKGDYVVGDGEGDDVRLPVPIDGHFWVSDSTAANGWRAVSINDLSVPSEIVIDYRGDDDVMRILIEAKAAELSGEGIQDSSYWVLTHDELPDELIDSDESTSEASGAPGLRFSKDALGFTQLNIEVLEFTPASGGASGGAKAEINVYPGAADHDNGQPLYGWWNKSGKTQPLPDELYGSESVYPNRAGHWTHEDFSDSTGNDNDGTGTGMSTTTDIPFGSVDAWEFDSATDRVVVSDDPSLDLTDELTVHLWFEVDTDTTTFQGLVSKRQSFNSVNYSLALKVSTTMDWNFWDGSAFQGVNADFGTYFSTGSWQFVAGTMKQVGSDVEVKLYNGPDGEIASTTVLSNSLIANAHSLVFGNIDQSSWGFPLDGRIKAANVLNVALDADQIATIYNNQSSPADFFDTTATAESGPF